MVVADGQGVPLGVELASASPHEVTLIEPLLAQIAVPRTGPGRPRSRFPRLIYDRAADSDPLRDRLAKRGIDLICPIARIGKNLSDRMGASLGDTNDATSLSGLLVGSVASGDWSHAMSEKVRCSAPLSISRICLSQ